MSEKTDARLLMRPIKVHFADGDTLVTRINGTTEEINRYYLTNEFNRGQPDDPTKDRMVRAVRVEFLDKTNLD